MQVNTHEAKITLSGLVVAAEHGEEVIIARNCVAAARSPATASGWRRPAGYDVPLARL
jgi:antitoxin (DNA-binding transcriptional repressor) of toxin-antitoxin stability system